MTQKQNIQFATPETDFDWSMDKEGFSTYSKDERNQLSSLYENTLSTISEKEIVKGVWRMPRLSEAKKEVVSCEKPRGSAHTN